MKILLSGGTGFIGSYLTKALSQKGHQVTNISRRKSVETVSWEEVGKVVPEMDAVINLAGENIFDGRWTDKKKKSILESRTKATKILTRAIIEAGDKRPKVFISGSAVGYYGSRGSEVLTEESTAGDDFLAKVCVAWEAEAKPASEHGVRVVHPRIGIVLQKDGGALQRMLLPFQFFVGGPLGNGEQYFPWIHMADLVNSIIFALENEDMVGPFNATAPEASKMKEFAERLGKAMNRPSFFAVPEFILNTVLGEASEGILASQNVQPKKLFDKGFKFQFPTLVEALKNLLGS